MPSIEYLQSPDYRFVPGVGIGSRGAVASVALFTRVPVEEIRHIALDTSSRTSVTLIQVLCHHRYRIAPEFVPHGPDLAAMVRDYDAGLLIGDPAFEADHAALGVDKDRSRRGVDGDDRAAVHLCGVDRPRRRDRTGDDVRRCRRRRRKACASYAAIAAEYGAATRRATARAARYLRDNMRYGLGPDEAAGLQMFLDYAADLGLAPKRRRLEFF